VPKHTFEELNLKLANSAITLEQEAEFRGLIEEFENIFALNNEELPGTDRVEFKINLQQDSRPVRQKPCSYSQAERTEIEKQIQELLAVKFMRHSVSPWCTNVLLVKKKNGDMRFCIDYRSLKKCINQDIQLYMRCRRFHVYTTH